MIEVMPYTKLNGKTYWRVYYNAEVVGQFFTLSNARRFVRRELSPAITRGLLRNG